MIIVPMRFLSIETLEYIVFQRQEAQALMPEKSCE